MFWSQSIAQQAQELTGNYPARRKAALPTLIEELKTYVAKEVLCAAEEGYGALILRFDKLPMRKLTTKPTQRLFGTRLDEEEIAEVRTALEQWATEQGLRFCLSQRKPYRVTLDWRKEEQEQ